LNIALADEEQHNNPNPTTEEENKDKK